MAGYEVARRSSVRTKEADTRVSFWEELPKQQHPLGRGGAADPSAIRESSAPHWRCQDGDKRAHEVPPPEHHCTWKMVRLTDCLWPGTPYSAATSFLCALSLCRCQSSQFRRQDPAPLIRRRTSVAPQGVCQQEQRMQQARSLHHTLPCNFHTKVFDV